MDEELKGLLVAIGEKLDSMDRKIDALQGDVTGLKKDVTDMKANQGILAARLDEQRVTIAQIGGTVNALIPTRLAAVPPSAAE